MSINGVKMKVPIEQHYSKVNGEFVLTSTKYIEIDEKVFAERMAELFHNATK